MVSKDEKPPTSKEEAYAKRKRPPPEKYDPDNTSHWSITRWRGSFGAISTLFATSAIAIGKSVPTGDTCPTPLPAQRSQVSR